MADWLGLLGFESVMTRGLVFGTDVNLKAQTVPEYNESTLSIEEVLDELVALIASGLGEGVEA
jgi:hypothetical protein